MSQTLTLQPPRRSAAAKAPAWEPTATRLSVDITITATPINRPEQAASGRVWVKIDAVCHELPFAQAMDNDSREAAQTRIKKAIDNVLADWKTSTAAKESARWKGVLDQAEQQAAFQKAAATTLEGKISAAIAEGKNPATLQAQADQVATDLARAEKWADAARTSLEPAQEIAQSDLKARLRLALTDLHTAALAEQEAARMALMAAAVPHLEAYQRARQLTNAIHIDQVLELANGST